MFGAFLSGFDSGLFSLANNEQAFMAWYCFYMGHSPTILKVLMIFASNSFFSYHQTAFWQMDGSGINAISSSNRAILCQICVSFGQRVMSGAFKWCDAAYI